jgi:gas vesicle protein
MSLSLIVGLLIAGLLAAMAWLLVAPKRMRGYRAEVVDPERLEAAEEEVRDLDVFTSPDDADDELPDWGPGAPK